MKLVTKYQISAINSYSEKCAEKYLGQMEGRTDGRMEGGKTVYPPRWSEGINMKRRQTTSEGKNSSERSALVS